MDSGIYRIDVGSRFYFGQSVSMSHRWQCHLSELRLGKHNNRYLQNVVNKRGVDALSFSVVCMAPVDKLTWLEQCFLDRWHGTKGCMNLARCSKTPGLGRKLSRASRAKISKALKGRQIPEDVRLRSYLGRAGPKHHKYLHQEHLLEHPSLGSFSGTKWEFEQAFPCVTPTHVSKLLRGILKTHKGWRHVKPL